MDERAGPWILGEVIAAGELAEVRVGRAGAAEAAIKRLHAHAARDPAVQALFRAEATLTCALPPHPRVVRGRGHDLDGDRPHLVLERVDGIDLRAQLGIAHAPAQVAAIVAGAAAAVAFVHAQGWVHGDVVPANLIVGPDGPVLCDLGVARAIGVAGPVRGTAAYMAPEQVRGQAWTTAVDVFALGVIAWELATGARLFHRGASYLSMAAVVETAAPALDDTALAAVVAAALAKDPAARPTAAELGAALAP
ncbi:MAG: protein kinase [Myxococcales bacterium]|nr:protein kinase [Myxococcales bacterium]